MPDTQPKKFYLTTPIYYVNARPHIGHAYTTIVADVVARRHRLLGDDTWFLTGTDEHGQKIERAAAAQGIPPQQFADQVSASFSDLWKRMGITINQFIRTTDPRHIRGVQKLFSDLYARGFIELRTYTGQYSVGEEMFVEGPPGTIGPDGKPTETVSEENFFFKLSEFQLPLINLIESNQLLIQPESRRNEVLSFLRGNIAGGLNELLGAKGNPEAMEAANDKLQLAKSASGNHYIPGALKDLSISRSSFTWGVPVPEPAASTAKEKHVIYVWLDALANYMTAIGYGSDDPTDQANFEKYWPADLHLVGKEIIRFHCVYWPAFLMAARLPLPKSIVAHGWLLFEESKMSKSRGNIVRTETILDAFGTLCPATPLAPPTNAVILSAAKDPEAADTATSDRPFPPQNPPAPTPPTKTQQDLFAADILRYFLLREIPFGQDGSFSFDAVIQRYNSDLANGYGNLVSRTLNMINQFGGGSISEVDTEYPGDFSDIWKLVVQAVGSSEKLDFADQLIFLSRKVAALDGLLTSWAPWKLAKSGRPEDIAAVKTQLSRIADAIRIITAQIYPILPYATASVWQQLGLGSIEEAARNGELKDLQWGGLKPGTKLGPLSPIFPRADKGLAQIMTEMESPTPTPEKSVSSASSVLSSSPEPTPTDPHAGPRTATLPIENPGTTVAGSHALTTERPGTPPHTEAPASGVFASTQNSQLTTHNSPPEITIDDFVKIDLRVAQIVVAERIPKADKLLRLEVDLGPGFTPSRRQILSGIAEWYTPEELIGRRIAIIANLAPRKMRGLESHGMLLAASAEDHASKPILATFSDEVPLGSRIR
jgi:methionyl-tRNA synthetase